MRAPEGHDDMPLRRIVNEAVSEAEARLTYFELSISRGDM
jgi:hypothetical protein